MKLTIVLNLRGSFKEFRAQKSASQGWNALGLLKRLGLYQGIPSAIP